MKLLTPQQVKDAKQQQDLKDILRTEEMKKIAQEARHELANSQADFNTMLAQNREKWALEEQEHINRVNERKAEIDRLEAARLNALVPVNILKANAEEQLSDAQEYVEKLRKREEYNEELSNKLEDKLDEVGAKEQDLKRKELELDIRQDGIEHQSIAAISSTQLLNQQTADFLNYKQQENDILLKKRLDITTKEQHLVTKANELEKKDEELKAVAIRLADERGVLDRAFKEVQRMKSNIPIVK